MNSERENAAIRRRDVVIELLRRAWAISKEVGSAIVFLGLLLAPAAVVTPAAFIVIQQAPKYTGTPADRLLAVLFAAAAGILTFAYTGKAYFWAESAWKDARRSVQRRLENGE